MNFTFLEVKDSVLLEKVFEFRYKIFLEIFPKYIQKLSLPDKKEHDEYDPYSSHFVALTEDGEICATVRLIYNSPLGYPTENSMVFDKDMFERDKLGEMSRIFIDIKYRNIKTTKNIMNGLKKLMYFKMMKLGIKYTYGSLEKSFLRLLVIFKIPYHAIGEEQEYECFSPRFPSILYTKQFGNDNPELIKLWKKHHEIQNCI